MGFLGMFGKKQKNLASRDDAMHGRIDTLAHSVVRHFNNIKDDITLQKRWVEYLHNVSKKLNEQQKAHKDFTQNDINNLKKWINHLHSTQTKQENDIKELGVNIKDVVNALNSLNSNITSQINELKQSKPQVDHEQIKQKVMENVSQHLNQQLSAHTEKTNMILRQHTDNIKKEVASIPPPQPEIQVQHSPLTNPEQKLLNLLLQEPDPVGYSKIAEITGNSVNTVRVVMNNLKKRDVIEETLLPSGEKLFAAKNKEKVKKIYNIQHL